MNKTDYIYICLDSCRYDTFKRANAPNMKSLGKLKKGYSYSTMTPAWILPFMLNFSPYNVGLDRLYPYKKMNWLPDQLKKDGYITAFFTANDFIPMMDIALKGRISKSFIKTKFLEYERKTSVESIVEDCIEFLSVNINKPFFLLLLLMETHTPFYNGKKSLPSLPIQIPYVNFIWQKQAIEFIDKKLEKLFKYLIVKSENVEVTITADHGEMFGPISQGHDPNSRMFFGRNRCSFDKQLHEVPFLRGILK